MQETQFLQKILQSSWDLTMSHVAASLGFGVAICIVLFVTYGWRGGLTFLGGAISAGMVNFLLSWYNAEAVVKSLLESAEDVAQLKSQLYFYGLPISVAIAIVVAIHTVVFYRTRIEPDSHLPVLYICGFMLSAFGVAYFDIIASHVPASASRLVVMAEVGLPEGDSRNPLLLTELATILREATGQISILLALAVLLCYVFVCRRDTLISRKPANRTGFVQCSILFGIGILVSILGTSKESVLISISGNYSEEPIDVFLSLSESAVVLCTVALCWLPFLVTVSVALLARIPRTCLGALAASSFCGTYILFIRSAAIFSSRVGNLHCLDNSWRTEIDSWVSGPALFFGASDLFPLLFPAAVFWLGFLGLVSFAPSTSERCTASSDTVNIWTGGAMTFLGYTLITGVTKTATIAMMEETRQQFRETPGILDGTMAPDYLLSLRTLSSEIGIGTLLIAIPLCAFAAASVTSPRLYEWTRVTLMKGMIPTAFVLLLVSQAWWIRTSLAMNMVSAGAYGGKGSDAHRSFLVVGSVAESVYAHAFLWFTICILTGMVMLSLEVVKPRITRIWSMVSPFPKSDS